MTRLPGLAAESVSALLSRKGSALGGELASRFSGKPAAARPPVDPMTAVLDHIDRAVIDHAQGEADNNIAIHIDMFSPPTPVAPAPLPPLAAPRRLSDLIL